MPPSGVLCLDYVNTIDLRRSLRVESLRDVGDLVAWAQEHAGLPEREARGQLERAARDPRGAAAALERALALREALFAVLSAAIAGAEPPAPELEALNAALAEHAVPPRLAPGEGGLRREWLDDRERPDWVLGPVLRSAADLLTGDGLARVRECPGSPGKACGWLFVDRTKNGNRRWCVGGLCGNRDRARRHYARGRTGERG